MALDKTPDERADRRPRQTPRTRAIQCGAHQRRSESGALVCRVDLGMRKQDDARPPPVLREPRDDPVDGDSKRPRSGTSVTVGVIGVDYRKHDVEVVHTPPCRQPQWEGARRRLIRVRASALQRPRQRGLRRDLRRL